MPVSCQQLPRLACCRISCDSCWGFIFFFFFLFSPSSFGAFCQCDTVFKNVFPVCSSQTHDPSWLFSRHRLLHVARVGKKKNISVSKRVELWPLESTSLRWKALFQSFQTAFYWESAKYDSVGLYHSFQWESLSFRRSPIPFTGPIWISNILAKSIG